MSEPLVKCDLCGSQVTSTTSSFEVKIAERDVVATNGINFNAIVLFRVTDLGSRSLDANLCEECVLKSVLSKPYRLMQGLKGRHIPEIEREKEAQ